MDVDGVCTLTLMCARTHISAFSSLAHRIKYKEIGCAHVHHHHHYCATQNSFKMLNDLASKAEHTFSSSPPPPPPSSSSSYLKTISMAFISVHSSISISTWKRCLIEFDGSSMVLAMTWYVSLNDDIVQTIPLDFKAFTKIPCLLPPSFKKNPRNKQPITASLSHFDGISNERDMNQVFKKRWNCNAILNERSNIEQIWICAEHTRTVSTIRLSAMIFK